ncbi:MAG: CDP-alcohol phosphatidyltransferase family protein [Deltaproteobacteria bacterium]|nr:CDP-alcohol phosphatidyltransferase family protein [Deltaproteobacteria bacterium]
MTVPNLITMIRIILTPVFVIYLIQDEFFSALVVFVLCGLSDGADGMVARLFNQKSRLGTYLDPLADKIVLASGFVVLSVRDFMPSWLAVMVLARDVLILLGVVVMALNRVDLKIKPSILSKITTCLQFITLIAVLSRNHIILPAGLYPILLYATAFFTIASGLHYIHFWFRCMGDNNTGRKNSGIHAESAESPSDQNPAA